MDKEIKFRKDRIFLGIILCILLLILSSSFMLKPDIFMRNVFMKREHIQIIGTISFIFDLALLYSLLKILPKKYAIIITHEFLIDNSKYESLGKIKWGDISKIQRFKKRNIELFLNKKVFKTEKRNWLKKFLSFMLNWNYNKSILISSAFLDCSIEELFKTITDAYQDFKSI